MDEAHRGLRLLARRALERALLAGDALDFFFARGDFFLGVRVVRLRSPALLLLLVVVATDGAPDLVKRLLDVDELVLIVVVNQPIELVDEVLLCHQRLVGLPDGRQHAHLAAGILAHGTRMMVPSGGTAAYFGRAEGLLGVVSAGLGLLRAYLDVLGRA